MRKLIVIGIDGLTFDLLDPLIAKGELKLFKKWKEEGCYGRLQSTTPALTPPAWNSSFTGVNPGKHNIFDFFTFDKNLKKQKVITSKERKYPAFWEICSRNGISLGLYNIPCNYPADKINGFLVTGMATPKDSRGFAYPEELENNLKNEFKKRFGSNTLFLEQGKRKTFLEDIYSVTAKDEEIALSLFNKRKPDISMFVYDESDRVFHFYYHDYDETHPSHDPESEFKNAIPQYLKRIEEGIEKFLSNDEGDVDLIIYSDHGFGPLYRDIYVNNLLFRWGYLKVNCYAKEMAKKPLWKKTLKILIPPQLRKIFREKIKSSPLSNPLAFIDFENSQAFYSSVSGRSIIILDEDKREKIALDLKNRLESYVDEKTKIKPFKKVYLREEIYKGDFVENAPDIIIEEDGRYAFKTEWNDEVLKDSSQYNVLKSGSHRKDGVLILYGNSFKKGIVIKNATVMDICPTILHLSNLPTGEEMDGRILLETLVETKELKKVSYKNLRESSNLSDFDEEAIKERLKSLGYM
jgi:predicted AlkP superfamily phosphohydrolase/phosphomutase